MQSQVQELFLGIDLGTSGVRALITSATGQIVAQAAERYTGSVPNSEGQHEQDPTGWWQAVCRVAQSTVTQVSDQGRTASSLRGVSVSGTSGTIVAVDGQGQAVRPALMYSDKRGAAEAVDLNKMAGEWCLEQGYRFEPSFGLAKIAWLARHEPATYQRTDRFVHQCDYIARYLAGEPTATDYTCALKTGYDLLADAWPAWIGRLSGIGERLPTVVPPGTLIGQVCASAAAATGLPVGTPILAGATDGVAAAIAAGLRSPGQSNTTLGTTLVFKRLTTRQVRQRDGLVYSHKLPGGMWLPGAASNTGSSWIGAWFAGQTPAELDQLVAGALPSSEVAYPLVTRGERFPFRAAQAQSFGILPTDSLPERYAACLTGTALVERLAYDVLDEVSGACSGEILSTGGGSRSDVWMQCRANVTQRCYGRPRVAETALGAAILSAAGTVHQTLSAASEAMTGVERWFTPDVGLRSRCDDLFGRFRAELSQRGYLSPTDT